MSAKDRAALFMMNDAIQKGQIKEGGTFVEASSGNTGMSMAMLAKEWGYQAKIFVSRSCSEEKLSALRGLGASIEICDNSYGPDHRGSTQYAAKRYATQHPESFFTDQYHNPANVQAHFETTGPEIWQQTAGRITHFIAGIGTGGTISGVGQFLKSQNKDIKIWGVEPKHSIFQQFLREGTVPQEMVAHDAIEGIGRTFVPSTFDPSVVDRVLQVSEEASKKAALWYKNHAGSLLGYSSAALIAAVCQSQEELPFKKEDQIVLLFPDHGGRYISKLYSKSTVWNDLVM